MDQFNPTKRKILSFEQFGKTTDPLEKGKHVEKGEADITKNAMGGEVVGDKGYATLEKPKMIHIKEAEEVAADAEKVDAPAETDDALAHGTMVVDFLKDMGVEGEDAEKINIHIENSGEELTPDNIADIVAKAMRELGIHDDDELNAGTAAMNETDKHIQELFQKWSKIAETGDKEASQEFFDKLNDTEKKGLKGLMSKDLA